MGTRYWVPAPTTKFGGRLRGDDGDDAMILTEEQQMIRDAARDFAQEQLAPNADTWAKEGKVPMDV